MVYFKHFEELNDAYKEKELAMQVKKVILGDGRSLSTNLVVVGVGARPNLGPFKGLLEEEKGGFKVITLMIEHILNLRMYEFKLYKLGMYQILLVHCH